MHKMKHDQREQEKFTYKLKCIMKSYLEWIFQNMAHFKKTLFFENGILSTIQNKPHEKNDHQTVLYLWLFVSLWEHPLNTPGKFRKSSFKNTSMIKISENIKILNQIMGCHDYDNIIEKCNVEDYIDSCVHFIKHTRDIQPKNIETIKQMIDFLHKWNDLSKLKLNAIVLKTQNRCYSISSAISRMPISEQRNIMEHVRKSISEKITKRQNGTMKSNSFFSRRKISTSDLCNSQNKFNITPETEVKNEHTVKKYIVSNEQTEDLAIDKNLFVMELATYIIGSRIKQIKTMCRNQKNIEENPLFDIKFLIAECTCKTEMFSIE